MSETNQSTAAGEQWSEYAEELNRSFVEAFEQNMRMQTEFLDSWRESLADSDLDETTVDGMQGASRAYEVWMEAADAQYELVGESLRGEDVDLDEFRDVWLTAANDAFKEVMGTSAFAAATGQTVGDMLEASEQLDQLNRETLGSLGFATDGDIQEVGERLVELERRQHAVEQKLDRLVELVEEANTEEP
ncbi:MAG: poly(R)-hydroxyalkanoic acid synthase subunit [Euryarchaeota archaeon]|nr:poly(R)-hydroxyalkanoic acid synthase subunit [Euryarchaeota archaeon]